MKSRLGTKEREKGTGEEVETNLELDTFAKGQPEDMCHSHVLHTHLPKLGLQGAF